MNWTHPGRTRKKLSWPYSTLWISVSSKSSTRVYVLSFSYSVNGGKKGGVTFGRLVKLFGNTAFWVAAIAEAFKIANGFFPVTVWLFPPLPTRLFVPEDLSLSLIILFAIAELLYVDIKFLDSLPELPRELVLELLVLSVLLFDMGFNLISGWSMASNLNCSIL